MSFWLIYGCVSPLIMQLWILTLRTLHYNVTSYAWSSCEGKRLFCGPVPFWLLYFPSQSACYILSAILVQCSEQYLDVGTTICLLLYHNFKLVIYWIEIYCRHTTRELLWELNTYLTNYTEHILYFRLESFRPMGIWP